MRILGILSICLRLFGCLQTQVTYENDPGNMVNRKLEGRQFNGTDGRGPFNRTGTLDRGPFNGTDMMGRLPFKGTGRMGNRTRMNTVGINRSDMPSDLFPRGMPSDVPQRDVHNPPEMI